ncbi:UNVERIFIED_CONTAM: hypothetical protein H355_011843, partial [Colinus virginianus]
MKENKLADKDADLKNEKASTLSVVHIHKLSLFRQVLFQILCCKVPVICFNAKDFLKTVLQVYGNEISWKQVADSVLLDPRIAAWLINSSDTVPSFECLIQDFEKSYSLEAVNTDTGALRISVHQSLVVNLQKLYSIMMGLAHDLQVQGLWKLFCSLELPLIKVLAVMETHKIHMSKQELKKTSEILGLSKLQDLHPLPKIMLEYRQRNTSFFDVFLGADGGCYFCLTAGIYLSYVESDRDCDWQAFIQAS